MLSLSSRSALRMCNLGVSAFARDIPIHLDGIDVFISPFIWGGQFVHDYHVPLVPELVWLGYLPFAAIAHTLLPHSIKSAKAIIAPNWKMLAHAAKYAKLPDFFIIPNYPPKSFYVSISQEEARARLGLPNNERIALFVGAGRLKEIYGIDLLFDSWRELRRKAPDALLYVLGPKHRLGLDRIAFMNLKKKGIVFPGQVEYSDVPIWISAADLCLSQRTPGFPVEFYNIYDSLKLSEYALFRKPIVAAGYLPGPDYISANTTVESYSRAILSGLKGNAPRPTPHTWEENYPILRKAYKALQG